MNWMNGMGKKSGCHTGNIALFEVDGITVYGGGHTRNGGWHVMSPAPDLAMGPAQVMDRGKSTVVPQGFSCANHIGGDTHIISIDWPDFDIPVDVGRDWWLALVDDIKRLGIKTVSTQCVGGHGRTGVQLAILAHLMGAIKQPDAATLIKWVRSNYCHHAVETYPQQEYVAQCCNLPVGERLFAKPKKNKISFDDEPTSNPSIYWAEEDEDSNLKIPDGFDILGCEECGNLEWVHKDDDGPCRCGNPDRQRVTTDILWDVNAECLETGKACTQFELNDKGQCKEAAMPDAKVNKDGNIKCKKCGRFYIPEAINAPNCICIGCERRAKLKKTKKNGKKNKNPSVPKEGLAGTTLEDFLKKME